MQAETRAFVAIPIPELVTNIVVDLQRQVENSTDDFYRWVPVSAMHLTLYFLGECSESTMNEVHMRLARVTVPPLTLHLGEVIPLPEPNVPRILAVALAGDLVQLKRLQQQVQDLVGPIAPYKETRLFRPHISFGRLRKDKPSNAKQVKRTMQALTMPSTIEFTIDHFCTMRSDLSESGAAYDVMESFNLS